MFVEIGPQVGFDALALADKKLKVRWRVALDDVSTVHSFRPAGIRRAGIRLKPESESAVETGDYSVSVLPG